MREEESEGVRKRVREGGSEDEVLPVSHGSGVSFIILISLFLSSSFSIFCRLLSCLAT